MRIKVSRTIPAKHHDLIQRLIQEGFRGVAHAGVEVHVKAKGNPWSKKHLERAVELNAHIPEYRQNLTEENRRHRHQFTGRFYSGIPSVARVAATTRFLVTLTIPPDLDDVVYPRTWHYPRLKTSPRFTFADWHEELVHLASHEAHHLAQLRRRGGKQSEIRAERWAMKALDEWRSRRDA